jgi:hypothetical protein
MAVEAEKEGKKERRKEGKEKQAGAEQSRRCKVVSE